MTATYTIRRERITWFRWSPTQRRTVVSHPWQWIVTEPDGYERCFDTKREAQAWIEKQQA